MANWPLQAKRLVRAEMKRSGVSYEELAKRLVAIGVPESAANLRNKISRGTFKSSFFFQCMAVMDVTTVYLDNLGLEDVSHEKR